MPTTRRRLTVSCAATRSRWAGTAGCTTATSTRCSTWRSTCPETAGKPARTSATSKKQRGGAGASSLRATASAARRAPAVPAAGKPPRRGGNGGTWVPLFLPFAPEHLAARLFGEAVEVLFVRRQLLRGGAQYEELRRVDARGRRRDVRRGLEVHGQALLAARHGEIHLRQQARIQQRAMQRTVRVVHAVALAQGIE